MAGGVHASSPGSATVTHQMGHSAFPPEYTLHSQTVLENGVSVNESSHNGEASTSRKRKLSTDAANHQLDTKRTCIYNHLLTDMIIEKEKYLYISLLDKYRCGEENDFFNFVDKINYSDSVLPFPNPHQPKLTYLSNEPDHFKTAFPNDQLLSGFKKVIKQESSESTLSSQTDFSSKTYSPIVLIRPACRTSNHVGDSSQQVAEKAKQEAYVLQRVADLQKCGLWSEKRLPKIQEPPRIKTHWDYVLEELEWLATDFAQERKWKKAAAKKRSRMVQKHFQEREALVQKAAKAAELHKKKISGHLAQMVRTFWSSVEKLADFKQEMKLKEKRQHVLDQRFSLSTEKYSSSVAGANKSQIALNQDLSRLDSPDKNSDAEFEPNQSSSDDEETIEAEENSSKAEVIDPDKEIEMLKRESELPLEDLLNQLPEEYLNSVETNVKINDKKLIDDDDEYEMDIDESDDESTLLEEEKMQGKVDYKSEIAELEADNKLSVEDLKKKYNVNCAAADPVINSLVSSYSESSSDDSREESSIVSSCSDNEISTTDDDQSDENDNDDDGLLSLLKDNLLENGDLNDDDDAAADEKINDIAATAESIQPKGITLSSTRTSSKVPFLLKHSLREYQHIGMDWLVAMYERNMNGILADEIGLGKTIQTIALLAHLAAEKEEWGPHLIIVPTSVMLNWEMEFKKWCPAFKILTYCGNPKERKLKRSDWTEPNTFHVCITSYKLVLQDHRCFRRKKWKYVILDEAQNIKNFKSQRWQRLLNFDSQRRLLLTGAPLQNNLADLWSSMNFLMPNLFKSHREFKEWFSNPVSSTSDNGNSEYNENIVKRLHKILRPFLLRRSKSEVEKQLPKRNEQVIMCKLSNRQRYLYDDYMSRTKTKETLSSGNLLNVINVLMQLRKVCNHPNLLEPRPIISPFQMDSLNYHTASLIDSALDYRPFEHVNLKSLNLRIVDVEDELTAWGVHRMRKLGVPKKLIEEIDDVTNESPACPKEMINLRLKVPHDLSSVKLNNNNSKSNLKVASFFKNISASVSQASSTSNATVNTTSVTSPSSKAKLGPIYRGMIAQGEVNNMAVKRSKLMDNTSNNKGGNLTFQLKTTKFNTVPQKICITTTSSKTPIHATVLKNVLPVTLKNTQTGGNAAESGNGVVGASSSASATNVGASVSTVATPSTSYASSSGTTAVSLPTVMVSTSVISIAPAGSSPSTKLSNSISQIVQNSAGKSVILATSNSSDINESVICAVKTSGQKVILKNIGPGNLNTILGPIIRKPSAQQATILNNGNNSAASSSIILNNTQKTSITIPKPISTFVTSTVAVSTVTSSVSQSDTVSTTVGVSNRNNRDGAKASKDDILFDNQCELDDKRIRREKLRVLGEINKRKSSPYVMFGCDVRNTLKILDVDSGNKCPTMNDPHYWKCAGHTNCINAQYAKHVYGLCYTLTNALSNSVKSIEERIEELSDTFSRFIVYVPSVNARRPTMRVSRPSASKSCSLKYMECVLERELAPRSEYLRQIVSRMSTSFPDTRLIQHDCGKLRTLDALLRRLKVEQHRVLIFTQMSRMLDMLEAFLTFRGHIYLRLDGGTKIDQRQVLMEKFNADERYFCFILSTRFGGIGVNLTGADTVIFYDSDLNPTMDAQTLGRCHRIGLSRDLSIYRLLSEKTVEENIAKKTNQKKLLAEVTAIDDGNLMSARLKSTTIRDLFDVDTNESNSATKADNMLINWQNVVEKSSTTLLSTFENVLAEVEDEIDVNAAKLAKEETLAELNEFDESAPILVDNEICRSVDDSTTEISEAEQTVDALLEQLTPIERWALRFKESSEDTEWPSEEHSTVAVAETMQIEQQKKEWETERFSAERAEKRSRRLDNEDDENDIMLQLMYSSEDSKNQAWLSFETLERMPIWLPLPPLITIEENEEYIDRSLNYLYETSVPMPEHLLPPVYFRKEKKKLRLDQPSPNINESSSHIRVRSRHREGLNATLSVAALEPPKSLFDRPSPVVAKLRQDMRLQKYRGLSRSTVPNVPGLKPYFPPKINADPEFVPEWLIHEDYALLQAIQHVQELPLNLSVMYPGHTPNWDLVSELVNQVSRIYRSPQQCKNRFETAILPREEGKLTSDPIWKKQKKMKGVNPLVTQMKYTRNYKTAQLYVQDSNSTYTQMMNARFDAIRGVSNRRAPTLKRLPLNTTTKNPKHAQLLAECEIDYDRPLTPVEIAAKRAQRLAKEKQTQMASVEQRPANANVATAGQQQQQLQVAAKPAILQQTATVQQTAAAQQQQQQLQTQAPVAVHKSISIPTSNIVPQPTAVVVNISQNSPVTTSPVTIRSIVHRPLNVQEMIVAGSTSPQQQSSIVIPSTKTSVAGATATNVLSPSIQRIIPITQISTATTATGQRIVTAGSKTLTSPQLQLYRQQNAVNTVQVRQQQLKILQATRGGKTSVVVPANMVVTSPSQQQQQQQQQSVVLQTQTQQQSGTSVQPQQQPTQQTQQQSLQPRQLIKSVAAGAIPTSTTRSITEAEMAVIIKKQQQQQQQHQQQQQQQQQIAQQQKIASATVIVTSNATTTPTQFITAQSTSGTAQNAVGVTLPTIKTANIKGPPTQAQIRQYQQIMQQRKQGAHKITPIGQVMVNVTQSGQVISHVLTKTTPGSMASAAHLMGARVIPVVASNSVKQTFQVVSASQLRATNNASNVNVDATGTARHIQQNLPPNTIKISGGTSSPVSVATFTHPQNFLNQVSAAIQNNSPLAVRPGNLRIQNATIASSLVSSSATSGNTVTSATATAATASPSANNNSNPSSAPAASSNNEKI